MLVVELVRNGYILNMFWKRVGILRDQMVGKREEKKGIKNYIKYVLSS